MRLKVRKKAPLVSFPRRADWQQVPPPLCGGTPGQLWCPAARARAREGAQTCLGREQSRLDR